MLEVRSYNFAEIVASQGDCNVNFFSILHVRCAVTCSDAHNYSKLRKLIFVEEMQATVRRATENLPVPLKNKKIVTI